MKVFSIITPVIYWMLTLAWAYILIFYIRKYRSVISKNIIKTLILILLIDSLRTLVESSYFGAWYTSLAGLIPIAVYDFLAQPQIVFFPKILNLVVAFIIILILLRRWIPQEAAKIIELQERVQNQSKTIYSTRTELMETQNRLQIAINNTGIGIWELSASEEQIHCSEEYFSLLEYDVNLEAVNLKDFINLIHEDDQEKTYSNINSCKEESEHRFQIDIRILTKHKNWKWIQMSGKCIPGLKKGDSEIVIGTFLDIDERKKSEQKILNSLEEKEILLGEVHHRVKNNMAILSSFLELKAMKSDDKEIIEILKDSRQRIHAMALIHNKLYENNDFSRISLREYIPQLIKDMLDTYNYLPWSVGSVIDVEDISLDLNSLITLGLVINEIISNSLKHAFEGIESPLVTTHVKLNEDRYIVVTIFDNGVGFDINDNILKQKTLGLVMIERLVQQLSGELLIENKNGIIYTIILPFKN